MTLLLTLEGLAVTASFGLLLAAIGNVLLRKLNIGDEASENLLFSLATGTIVFECAVDVGELLPDVRAGVWLTCAVCAVVALFGLFDVVRSVSQLVQKALALPGNQLRLAGAIAVVLLAEGFAAMAPLTGSDALHYHFTIPAEYLRGGFHADWFIPHSFFLGQSHQLILAGLALGSERLAMGLIFLGGAAAALSIVRLAQEWTSGTLPWIAALVFLLTPVVFWQTTAAGAPDVWMAFFVPMGVLAIVRARECGGTGYQILAGILAGGIAGAKYTGLVFALVLLIAFVAEIRSAKRVAIFFLTAVAAGCAPYVRNWVWTRDPVFPFFFRQLAPQNLNATALASYIADTRVLSTHELWALPKFAAFAEIEKSQLGYWQLLGPLVLCLAPLTLLAARKTPLWRVAGIVWVGGAMLSGYLSDMPRFALPALPIALAASFAGVALLWTSQWRLARATAFLAIGAYLLVGAAGLILYAKPAWAAATGRISREDYLRKRAPDFYRTEFVSQNAGTGPNAGKTLVFFRHVYYLRVPFLYGDPQESWVFDPAKLQAASELYELLKREDVRWILREEGYPPALRTQFEQLELQKLLIPCRAGKSQDFRGNRIGAVRVSQQMTLMCVQ